MVQQANANSLQSAVRVERGLVMLADPAKPFVRAGKGTVVRGATERAYEAEVGEMYARHVGA